MDGFSHPALTLWLYSQHLQKHPTILPLILLCYLIVCPFYTPRHLILSLTFSPLPLPGQPARHGVNAILRSLHPTYLAVSHRLSLSLSHTLHVLPTPHATTPLHVKTLTLHTLSRTHMHLVWLAGWRQPRAEKKRVQSMSIDMQYCTKTATAQTRRENENGGKKFSEKGRASSYLGFIQFIYMNNLPGSLLKHHMLIKTLKRSAITYLMLLFHFPAKTL